MNHIVNGFVSANSNEDQDTKNASMRNAIVQLIVMLIQIILVSLVGAWLWNNSVQKIVGNVGKANAWHMYYLGVLLHILLPKA